MTERRFLFEPYVKFEGNKTRYNPSILLALFETYVKFEGNKTSKANPLPP